MAVVVSWRCHLLTGVDRTVKVGLRLFARPSGVYVATGYSPDHRANRVFWLFARPSGLFAVYGLFARRF